MFRSSLEQNCIVLLFIVLIGGCSRSQVENLNPRREVIAQTDSTLSSFSEITSRAVYIKDLGSGVLYSDNKKRLFLLTAQHVLLNRQRSTQKTVYTNRDTVTILNFNEALPRSDPYEFKVDLKAAVNSGFAMDSANDVCVLPIGKFFFDPGTGKRKGGKFRFYSHVISFPDTVSLSGVRDGTTGLFKDVNALDEVFLIGYPINLGNLGTAQYEFDRPLVSKGIVAGKSARFKTIIVDKAAYGGNSGGPVFLAEKEYIGNDRDYSIRFKLIGIVTQTARHPYNIPLYQADSGKIRVDSTGMGQQLQHVVGYAAVNSGYSVVKPIEFAIDLIANIP